jgi:hypothetical protein
VSKEWIARTTLVDDGTRREEITHMTMPRFTARIVEINPFERTPVEEEGEVDLNGLAYRIDHKTIAFEIVWTDEVPEPDRPRLLRDAMIARAELRSGFKRWKSLDPVRHMADRLNLEIRPCQTWEDYTAVFAEENDRTDGQLVEIARSEIGVLSTGEIPVLLAMLHAADYNRVADELCGGDIWWRLSRTSGDHAEAVALAIMRA